jgi:hypothetical protein
MKDTKKDTKTIDPNSPATSRQLWALFCATRKDHRSMGLTYEQASKMLAEANQASGYGGGSGSPNKKRKPKPEDLALEYVESLRDEILSKVLSVYGIVSVVKTDTSMLPDDGKRFMFVGGGCGFAWYVYDKRSEKTTGLISKFNEAWRKVSAGIAQEVSVKLREAGETKVLSDCPPGAVMMQDLSFNCYVLGLGKKWINENGGKIKYVDSRLD